MSRPKRKSDERWQQLNYLVDHVCPTLPTPSHAAVLLVAFRHGRGPGFFTASTNQISTAVNLKRRRTQGILDDLESAGIIVMVEEHRGPIPRKYQITFSP